MNLGSHTSPASALLGTGFLAKSSAVIRYRRPRLLNDSHQGCLHRGELLHPLYLHGLNTLPAMVSSLAA